MRIKNLETRSGSKPRSSSALRKPGQMSGDLLGYRLGGKAGVALRRVQPNIAKECDVRPALVQRRQVDAMPSGKALISPIPPVKDDEGFGDVEHEEIRGSDSTRIVVGVHPRLSVCPPERQVTAPALRVVLGLEHKNALGGSNRRNRQSHFRPVR